MNSEISDKEALALKPKLPEVEPGLKSKPPRPMVWESARGWKITPEVEDILKNWTATKAWVTKYKEGWVKGPEAGPSYDIHYCFETENGPVHGRYYAELDGMHVGYGGLPAWLAEASEKGATFTILYNPEDSSQHKIFGELELKKK